MVTSYFRPEVEIRPFRACAMHPAIITGTVRSLFTMLWGRYHVPQNAYLVELYKLFLIILKWYYCVGYRCWLRNIKLFKSTRFSCCFIKHRWLSHFFFLSFLSLNHSTVNMDYLLSGLARSWFVNQGPDF